MTAPERWAGDHTTRPELPPIVDPRRDLLEPGPLVAIVERMMHLGDVRGRMGLVTFFEREA